MDYDIINKQLIISSDKREGIENLSSENYNNIENINNFLETKQKEYDENDYDVKIINDDFQNFTIFSRNTTEKEKEYFIKQNKYFEKIKKFTDKVKNAYYNFKKNKEGKKYELKLLFSQWKTYYLDVIEDTKKIKFFKKAKKTNNIFKHNLFNFKNKKRIDSGNNKKTDFDKIKLKNKHKNNKNKMLIDEEINKSSNQEIEVLNNTKKNINIIDDYIDNSSDTSRTLERLSCLREDMVSAMKNDLTKLRRTTSSSSTNNNQLINDINPILSNSKSSSKNDIIGSSANNPISLDDSDDEDSNEISNLEHYQKINNYLNYVFNDKDNKTYSITFTKISKNTEIYFDSYFIKNFIFKLITQVLDTSEKLKNKVTDETDFVPYILIIIQKSINRIDINYLSKLKLPKYSLLNDSYPTFNNYLNLILFTIEYKLTEGLYNKPKWKFSKKMFKININSEIVKIITSLLNKTLKVVHDFYTKNKSVIENKEKYLDNTNDNLVKKYISKIMKIRKINNKQQFKRKSISNNSNSKNKIRKKSINKVSNKKFYCPIDFRKIVVKKIHDILKNNKDKFKYIIKYLSNDKNLQNMSIGIESSIYRKSSNMNEYSITYSNIEKYIFRWDNRNPIKKN